MATTQAKAERRAAVLARLNNLIPIDSMPTQRETANDPELGQIVMMERIANQLEALAAEGGALPDVGGGGEGGGVLPLSRGLTQPGLVAALARASVEEIEQIPGVGKKSAPEIQEWARGELEAQADQARRDVEEAEREAQARRQTRPDGQPEADQPEADPEDPQPAETAENGGDKASETTDASNAASDSPPPSARASRATPEDRPPSQRRRKDDE